MIVLVIESNDQVIKDVCFCLQVRYTEITVIPVTEGHKGIEIMKSDSPDLVMVDTSLPDIEVLELISQIREFSDVPLIILYETENDIDIAKGLEAGADEYIAKSFSPIEFLARVRALLRRTERVGFTPEHLFTFANLTINFTTHEVSLSGEPVKLTPTEYYLLTELVRNEGRILTHRRLLDKVWGSEYDREFHLVKKYISRLRSKLERDKSMPQMIHTEWGIGYRFIKPA